MLLNYFNNAKILFLLNLYSMIVQVFIFKIFDPFLLMVMQIIYLINSLFLIIYLKNSFFQFDFMIYKYKNTLQLKNKTFTSLGIKMVLVVIKTHIYQLHFVFLVYKVCFKINLCAMYCLKVIVLIYSLLILSFQQFMNCVNKVKKILYFLINQAY